MHPERPPLPWLMNRPDQSSGSHTSKLIPDRFDVAEYAAMRQTSAATVALALPSRQVTFVSVKEMFEPPATYSVK